MINPCLANMKRDVKPKMRPKPSQILFAAELHGLRICQGSMPSFPDCYSDFLRKLCLQLLERNPENRPSAGGKHSNS